MARGIYVEVDIDARIEDVWQRTQDFAAHCRWDIRFSSIRLITDDHDGIRHFDYSRSVPFHTVRGTGVSLGEKTRSDGTRTSALRFSTTDVLSPIRSGRGYWRYVPLSDTRTRFITGYDYSPGWGRLLDLIVRPLLGWATAWSFDRLRLWLERGEEPEKWPLWSALWFFSRRRPRAARCRRSPANSSRERNTLQDAPHSLSALPDPSTETMRTDS